MISSMPTLAQEHSRRGDIMLQHLETIHYVVGILTAICGMALWVIRMHIQMIAQRLDLTDKYNKEQSRIHREHADSCLAGLNEIKTKLDKLDEDISRHNAEYSVLRVEVDAVKEKVERLENQVGTLLSK